MTEEKKTERPTMVTREQKAQMAEENAEAYWQDLENGDDLG